MTDSRAPIDRHPRRPPRTRSPRSTAPCSCARRSASRAPCASAGVPIDLGARVDFARALTLVDIGDRSRSAAAGAAIFVPASRTTCATYDAVFDQWWRRRVAADRRRRSRPRAARRETRRISPTGAADRDPAGPSAAMSGPRAGAGMPSPADGEEHRRRSRRSGRASSSAPGRLLAVAEVFAIASSTGCPPRSCATRSGSWSLLRPRLETPADAPLRAPRHGRRLAPRAMFRRNLGTGGDMLDLGLAAADPRAALARGPVRHLGFHGASLAAPAAVRPGAVARVGGARPSRSCSGRGSPG